MEHLQGAQVPPSLLLPFYAACVSDWLRRELPQREWRVTPQAQGLWVRGGARSYRMRLQLCRWTISIWTGRNWTRMGAGEPQWSLAEALRLLRREETVSRK